MTTTVWETEESLEATIKQAILDMYEEVATNPQGEFHFFHGRTAAEMFEYGDADLNALPAGAVASFAGVGNPHLRADLQNGETVLDLGSGAGMDSILAARRLGPAGHMIGVDLNDAMMSRARTHAEQAEVQIDFRQGTMEDLPVDDQTIDAIISNGVINLSFRKRRVIQEMFRVLKPGGRISITDIVSARPLSKDFKEDPNLWAS